MPLKIQLLQGDITQLEVEAIVNSANNDFILGSGVSGAIHRLGGPEIQEECHRIGTRPLGSVATTTAGKLKAKYIIHAAVNPLGLWADAKSIRAAFRGSLRELRDKGIKSAAVPAIGTGAGAFSIDRCADILLEEVRDFAKTEPALETMIFVLFDEKNFKARGTVHPQVRSSGRRHGPAAARTAAGARAGAAAPADPATRRASAPVSRQRRARGQRPSQASSPGTTSRQPQPRPPAPAARGQPGPRPSRRDRGRRGRGTSAARRASSARRSPSAEPPLGAAAYSSRAAPATVLTADRILVGDGRRLPLLPHRRG